MGTIKLEPNDLLENATMQVCVRITNIDDEIAILQAEQEKLYRQLKYKDYGIYESFKNLTGDERKVLVSLNDLAREQI